MTLWQYADRVNCIDILMHQHLSEDLTEEEQWKEQRKNGKHFYIIYLVMDMTR